MHVVAIYNNKGGEGKSTLTVGLAEFLAANRKQRVLVIDLDAQASSAGAILGEAVKNAITDYRTSVDLAEEVRRRKKVIPTPQDFFTIRAASNGRGTALAELAVIVPDKSRTPDLEDSMTRPRDLLLFRDFVKPVLREHFDIVLIDMPSNVDRRNKLVINGLLMSDFVLIPVDPTQLSISALPETFDFIRECREGSKSNRPAVIGIVLNKADKRSQQYKSKFPAILEATGRSELPPIFDNYLPAHPKLATATDGTIDFRTLKDRFDVYYDHVRKVARELQERCDEYVFDSQPQERRYGRVFRDLLHKFALHK